MLQWIVTQNDPTILTIFPNNNDATFKDQQLPRPADLLLHYNYGAAAVKQWGKNTSVLDNCPDIPCPPVLVPVPLGPTRVKHNHEDTIKRRDDNVNQGGLRSERNTGEGAAADSEPQAS